MKLLKKCWFVFSLSFLLILLAINGCEKDDDKSGNTVSDADGNVYKTVMIGSQEWMAENLKTTVFNDKSVIPRVTSPEAWEVMTSPGYCIYNDADSNKTNVGVMYNWFAVNSGKLCPVGWHVPKDSDFMDLELTLGLPIAQINVYGWRGIDQGAQLKSMKGWINGEGNATNSSQFTALPGGYRSTRAAHFGGYGTITIFWTSNDDSYNGKPLEAWYRRLDAIEKKIYKGTTSKQGGHYIRCIKN